MVENNSRTWNRRKFVQTIGTSAVLGSTITTTVTADVSSSDYPDADPKHDDDTEEPVAAELGSCLKQFQPVWTGDLGEPEPHFYRWPHKISSTLMTYLQEDIPGYEPGEFRGVNKSFLDITFPDGKITSDLTENYVGGTEYSDNQYDASDVAGGVLQQSIGEVPYFGWVWSWGTAAAKMYADWENANDTTDSISRYWAWAKNNDGRYRSQADYWARFDAELDPEETISFSVTDEGRAVRSDKGSVILLENEYNYTITAPEGTNSGSVSTADSTKDHIEAVPARKVKENPFQYGLAPSDVAGVDDDDYIRFATGGFNVQRESSE